MKRGAFGAALGGAALSLMASAQGVLSRDAASTVTIAFIEKQVEISPDPGTKLQRRRIVLLLVGGSDIQEESTRVDRQGKERTAHRSGELAKGIARPQDKNYQTGWHVVNETTLQRIAIWPQHVETLTLETRGKQCSASVAYELSGNAKVFRMTDYGWVSGPQRYFSALEATDVTCRISSGG